MQLKVLVLTRDDSAAELLRTVFAKLGIAATIFNGPAAGLRSLKTEKFEGIVVDCDDLDCGADLLGLLRDHSYNKSSIVFALVNGTTTMHQAFDLGANFVLEKPLNRDRVLRCFRAAQGLMVGERRRYYRHPVDAHVELSFEKVSSSVNAQMLDVSVGGMLIRTSVELKVDMSGSMRFALPGTKLEIEGNCHVVWTRDGQAGLQFSNFKRQCRDVLESWITQKFEESARAIQHFIPDNPLQTAPY